MCVNQFLMQFQFQALSFIASSSSSFYFISIFERFRRQMCFFPLEIELGNLYLFDFSSFARPINEWFVWNWISSLKIQSEVICSAAEVTIDVNIQNKIELRKKTNNYSCLSIRIGLSHPNYFEFRVHQIVLASLLQ